LLYQGQVDDALSELRRAAELQPDNPAIHASLAKVLAAKGMTQESQEELRRAQAAQPQP
jgi:predicted Zn-dependent protease